MTALNPYSRSTRHPAISILAMASLLPMTVLAQTEIGSVSAANEQVLGTPPQRDQRVLNLGDAVVLDERVQTTDLGAGQFVFRDNTSLTVWPNSDIVLDRYVYDPDAGSGDMALTVTRGVLRFIGGQISKDQDVEVRTPHGIIAVRGGIGMIEVTAEYTRLLHIAGAYSELNGLRLARSNAAAVARGSQPDETEYLGQLDSEQLRALFNAPMGRGSGGLSLPPSNEQVISLAARTGLTSANAGRQGAANESRISTYREQEREIEVGEEDSGIALVPVRSLDAAQAQSVPPPLPPEPLSDLLEGVQGGSFVLSEATDYGAADVPDPASQNLVVLPNSPDRLTALVRLPLEPEETEHRLSARAGASAADEVFQMTERSTAAFFDDPVGAFGDRLARQRSFVDGENGFYLSAFSEREGEPFRVLGFMGTPTSPAFWDETGGAAFNIAEWTLSDELFSGRPLPLPEGFPVEIGGTLSTLMLLPEPGGARVGRDTEGAKWLLPVFALEGEGAQQRSGLGVLVSRAARNGAGAPVFADGQTLQGTGRVNSFDAGLSLVGEVGLLDDGAGETAFGPNGQYLVLGQGGRADETGLNRVGPIRLWGEVLGQPVASAYGDTRLATLAPSRTISGPRVTLGEPRSDGRQRLTAGFAATNATAQGGGSYLLRTRAADGVQVAFDAARNGVTVQINDLIARVGDGSPALSRVSLSFGGEGSGAMIDDRQFAARATASGMRGEVRASAANTEVTGFSGALISADLAEPAETAATPAYLRWGWWGGTVSYGDPETNLVADDRLHLGSFVSGVRSPDDALIEANLANLSATYRGAAISHVVETIDGQQASYIDRGDFRLSYYFGTHEGLIELGILGRSVDGGNPISGSVVASSRGDAANHYGGNLSVPGAVRGAFFTAGADALGATAGSYELSTTGLSGGKANVTGIFGGERVPSP